MCQFKVAITYFEFCIDIQGSNAFMTTHVELLLDLITQIPYLHVY